MFKKNTILLFAAALGISSAACAQSVDIPEKAAMHHELPDEKSVPMALDEIKTSPAYVYESTGFFTIQANVNSEGENILGDAANEPSIAVDPTNPDRIMIGWRQFDNVNSNFRQAGYAYSLDAGQSWTFPGSIDAGVFRSDPVLDCDPEGNFYYNSLTVTASDDFICTVYKTADGAVEWDEGTFAQGGDKQWMRIDKTNGVGAGNNYSFWTKYWSYCYPNFFTRSTNLGASYEPCTAIPGEPYWGTLAVGPEGELYIAGAGEFNDVMVTKSMNAQVSGSTIEWSLYTSVDLDGQLTGWVAVNPAGLLGQAWVDVDVSDGPGRGNVYVLASVMRNSNVDPADVMFARSTDGGLTFDPPVRINDDASLSDYQWFGTMSVAPNGRIDAAWLDTRSDPWGLHQKSALFYSYSEDQGVTWSVNVQLSDIFDSHVGWPQQEKMGDYFDMVSDEGGAHLAWANTLNGEQDVYYAYITPGSVGVNEPDPDRTFIKISNYPNPFREQTSIRYTLGQESHVRLVVYDVFGKELAELVNEVRSAGTHSFNYIATDLPAGVYLCRLHAGQRVESLRMVKQ
ncbi:MAG: T9SS type A sorting domain-containing protein [Bacteroidales bacterium]|nr:T9SS type A sorting domain-containing protein [Bacteroidales bacterium]